MEAMDIVQWNHNILCKANRLWNIPFTFVLYHLNGKTCMFRKMGLVDVLTRNEDKPILEQILAMLKN
jgi:hypothetical protein